MQTCVLLIPKPASVTTTHILRNFDENNSTLFFTLLAQHCSLNKTMPGHMFGDQGWAWACNLGNKLLKN